MSRSGEQGRVWLFQADCTILSTDSLVQKHGVNTRLLLLRESQLIQFPLIVLVREELPHTPFSEVILKQMAVSHL